MVERSEEEQQFMLSRLSEDERQTIDQFIVQQPETAQKEKIVSEPTVTMPEEEVTVEEPVEPVKRVEEKLEKNEPTEQKIPLTTKKYSVQDIIEIAESGRNGVKRACWNGKRHGILCRVYRGTSWPLGIGIHFGCYGDP